MIRLMLIGSIIFAPGDLSLARVDTSAIRDSSGIQPKIKNIYLEYSPEIKKILKEKVGLMAKDVLQNDAAMNFTFGGIYEFLPLPLKWVVSKESFVSHCMGNRYLLIEQLPDKNIKLKK